MSLINDALRRADMEKRQRDSGAEPSSPPPLPPEETDAPPPRRRSPWTVLLGVALVILVGVVACGLWWGIGEVREQAGAAVETASAAFNQALARGSGRAAPSQMASAPPAEEKTASAKAEKTDLAAEAGTETASASASPEETDPAAEKTDSQAGADGPETASARDATADKAETDQALASGAKAAEPTPAEKIDPARSADAEQGGAPALEASFPATLFGGMPLAVGMPAPAAPGETPSAAGEPPADPAAPAESESPASGKPMADTEPPAAKKEPPAPLPPVDASHLKVSSIMRGPTGGLAIINGRPVREGESVAGAKVLRIHSRTVEVEIDGRRATVGM